MILQGAIRRIAYLRAALALAAAGRRKDLHAMQAAVQRLRSADPRDTMGLTFLAILTEERHNRPSAVPIWEEVLSIDATDVQALRRIADHWAKRGHPEMACEAIRRALSADEKLNSRPPIAGTRFFRFLGPLIGRDPDFFERVERAAKKSDRDWNKWARNYLAVQGVEPRAEEDEPVN